jgi:hypothetical protein
MPKLPMDYSKCCIYKIEHIDDESLVYVGHTTNFDKRKTAHKNNCYNENAKKYDMKVYQMIRENGGWDMFKMIEVEKFPCNDKRKAERRENEIMKQLKANMNTYRSFVSLENRKIIQKQYELMNKEKRKEQKKIYCEDNKDRYKRYCEDNKEEIKKTRKEYYEKNKERLHNQKKEYYEANKEKIKEKEKLKCECGCEVVKRTLKRHQTSKKHNELMNK